MVSGGWYGDDGGGYGVRDGTGVVRIGDDVGVYSFASDATETITNCQRASPARNGYNVPNLVAVGSLTFRPLEELNNRNKRRDHEHEVV